MFEKIKAFMPVLFRSIWTLIALVLLTLGLCIFTGGHLFLVWWLTFAGVVLTGLSNIIDNYAARQQNRRREILRGCAWLILVGGGVCFVATCIFPVSLPMVLMYITGSLCGVLFCLQVKNKDLLKWIR